nr:ATPase RavA domain-containing protein [Xenorhabdus koppenhoeferi]
MTKEDIGIIEEHWIASIEQSFLQLTKKQKQLRSKIMR